MTGLPPVAPWPEIHAKLQVIFPEGTPNRAQSTWEIAAKTVFVMVYSNAIEGSGGWLRPDQVTRMTDAQANLIDPASRLAWSQSSTKPSKGEVPGRWYAVNTRESIRDDTIRNSLVQNSAIVERPGLPITSPAGRYALQKEFAALLDPTLQGAAFQTAVVAWQAKHLTAAARMRIALLRKGAAGGNDRVLINYPGGETRLMFPGPSAELSKQVIEVFASKFLAMPAVIFLSESREKVISRDDELAKNIGLNILANKNLPDIILADLGPQQPMLVFVEVVASDGPVSEARKGSLLEMTDAAGFPRDRIAFVTAYFDRSTPQFKKTVDSLAWGTFAWFASEPDGLVRLTFGDARL